MNTNEVLIHLKSTKTTARASDKMTQVKTATIKMKCVSIMDTKSDKEHSLLVTLAGCSLSGQRQKLRNPSKQFCKEQESKKMASVYLGLRLLHGLQVSHVTSILFTLFTTTSSSPRRLTRAQLSLTSCLSAAHHS